jgi:hypothetical protein
MQGLLAPTVSLAQARDGRFSSVPLLQWWLRGCRQRCNATGVAGTHWIQILHFSGFDNTLVFAMLYDITSYAR